LLIQEVFQNQLFEKAKCYWL